MPYVFPTIPDFKTQFVRDFPYAVPLAGGGSGGAATAVLSGQSVDSITLDAGGSGYAATPTVILYGGGGQGATATATLTSDSITAVTVTTAGNGYQEPPTVYISNGQGDNTDLTKVTDYDIAKAFVEASEFNFNEALFDTQAAYTIAMNLLAAHNLVEDLLAGTSGISGQPSWLTQSKMVGNVHETFAIPPRILRSPFLSKLSRTNYGAKFLELIAPMLIGNLQSYYGGTRA